MSTRSTRLPQSETTFSAYEPTMTMHAEQRLRLVTAMREREDVADNSIAFFIGGAEPHHYDTDMEPIFRQESFFHYFFGVREPDYFAVIDIRAGTTTLFCPRLPAEFAIWMGEVHGPAHFKAQYGVEDVRFVDEMQEWLAARAAAEVHVLKGRNTDSGIEVATEKAKQVQGLPVATGVLHPVSVELRVLKTDAEVALMRHTNRLSSMAHMAVMRLCAAGRLESAMEAQFRYYVLANGNCRHLAYTPICASGTNPATLHYGHAGEPNGRVLQADDMVLNDMGAELHRYASDITCSFPVSGAFSPKQRVVYSAVLAAHKAVLAALKPGVAWPDMQTLAYRTMLSHLRDAGLVKGDLDAMMEANVGAVFMPHGLGHFIGIDTHDVGGYAPGQPERDTRAGFKNLRTARVMRPRMAVTVEPGCYFNAYSLEQAASNDAQAPFLDMDVIKSYMSVGGVRIEDNLIITEDGVENLTTCPREIEDVEACCRGEVEHFSAIQGIPGHVHHPEIDTA